MSKLTIYRLIENVVDAGMFKAANDSGDGKFSVVDPSLKRATEVSSLNRFSSNYHMLQRSWNQIVECQK